MRFQEVMGVYNALVTLGKRNDLDDIWIDLSRNIRRLKPLNKEYTDTAGEISEKWGDRDKEGRLLSDAKGNIFFSKHKKQATELTVKLNEEEKTIDVIQLSFDTLKDPEDKSKFRVNIEPNVMSELIDVIFVEKVEEEKPKKKEPSKG